MKAIKRMMVSIFLMGLAFDSSAQLVKKEEDAARLQREKDLFIGKPLGELLRKIGPEIRMVLVSDQQDDGQASYFIFRFTDRAEQRGYSKADTIPLGITVFVSGKLDWNKSGLPLSEREKWTAADRQKYAGLTVLDVRVSGSRLAARQVH